MLRLMLRRMRHDDLALPSSALAISSALQCGAIKAVERNQACLRPIIVASSIKTNRLEPVLLLSNGTSQY